MYGASDRVAAHPVSDRVDPADILAALYHTLGLDAHATIRFDSLTRPHAIREGRASVALL